MVESVPMPHREPLTDFPAVLALFSNGELANALGVKYVTAAAMKLRGRVEPRYWYPLVTAVRARGGRLTHRDVCRFAYELPSRPASTPGRRRRRSSIATTGPPP